MCSSPVASIEEQVEQSKGMGQSLQWLSHWFNRGSSSIGDRDAGLYTPETCLNTKDEI